MKSTRGRSKLNYTRISFIRCLGYVPTSGMDDSGPSGKLAPLVQRHDVLDRDPDQDSLLSGGSVGVLVRA